jgi:hypothetical protein
MITDNALITVECLHTIRSGNKACKEFGAYKLDLTKDARNLELINWTSPKLMTEWIGVI